MSLAVANQYAKALLEVVTDPRANVTPEQVLAQLDDFRHMLRESHDLRMVLHSPAIDHIAKKKALARLGGMLGLGEIVLNFLGVVVHKGRLSMLDEIHEMFRAQMDTRLGIARASVVAAQDMGNAERMALETELAKVTGKKVQCQYSVDSALLGGVTVKVGSKVYDGSVRGQFDVLERRLSSEA